MMLSGLALLAVFANMLALNQIKKSLENIERIGRNVDKKLSEIVVEPVYLEDEGQGPMVRN